MRKLKRAKLENKDPGNDNAEKKVLRKGQIGKGNILKRAILKRKNGNEQF